MKNESTFARAVGKSTSFFIENCIFPTKKRDQILLTLVEQEPSKVSGYTEVKYRSKANTIRVKEACCVKVPLSQA